MRIERKNNYYMYLAGKKEESDYYLNLHFQEMDRKDQQFRKQMRSIRWSPKPIKKKEKTLEEILAEQRIKIRKEVEIELELQRMRKEGKSQEEIGDREQELEYKRNQ